MPSDKPRTSGITVRGGGGNTIRGNKISGYDEGISLENSTDNVVERNEISSVSKVIDATGGKVTADEVQEAIALIRAAKASSDAGLATKAVEPSKFWSVVRELGPDVISFVLKTLMKMD